MTIDRMVQAKAEAYRKNPAVLKTTETMNQDLCDRLAWVRVEYENEDAAR